MSFLIPLIRPIKFFAAIPIKKSFLYRRHSSLKPAIASRNLNIIKKTAENKLLEAVLRNYAPASVLVNRSLDIQHILGDVSDYLTISAGKPTTNLMQLICRELKPDLQILQHQAERNQDSVTGRAHSIKNGEKTRLVRLAIHPTEKKVNTAYFIVCFEDIPEETETQKKIKTNTSESDTNLNVRELEDELITTRERLQTVIEELETSNEELQALNEEFNQPMKNYNHRMRN